MVLENFYKSVSHIPTALHSYACGNSLHSFFSYIIFVYLAPATISPESNLIIMFLRFPSPMLVMEDHFPYPLFGYSPLLFNADWLVNFLFSLGCFNTGLPTNEGFDCSFDLWIFPRSLFFLCRSGPLFSVKTTTTRSSSRPCVPVLNKSRTPGDISV